MDEKQNQIEPFVLELLDRCAVANHTVGYFKAMLEQKDREADRYMNIIRKLEGDLNIKKKNKQ